MRRHGGIVGIMCAVTFAVAACGGNPPPQQPQVNEDSIAQARADSIAKARQDSIDAAKARAEREASQLCQQAQSAMAAGNYDSARQLYSQAVNKYPDTSCAKTAGDALAKIGALEEIGRRIHFEFDKSRITDEAASILQKKAEMLKKYPQITLTVAGNCDERGSLEYNQALGMRRAESAKKYLVGLGIDGSRLKTVSYGEERPIAQGHDETAWAMNRRDDFTMDNAGSM